MGNASDLFGFDDANCKTPKSGDVFWTVAGAYAATIFIKIPIDDIVAAVLNTPMTAVDGKKTLSIGLVRGATGDAIGDFSGFFPGLFFYGVPFYYESLPNVGEVEIVVELGCGPDFTGFDPPMFRGGSINEFRFFSVLEVERNVFEETGLVSFDGEVIMGITFLDQVMGDFALGQQGIGGNIPSLDIDGIKERDGGLDFIGTFDLSTIFYRERTYFFWE